MRYHLAMLTIGQLARRVGLRPSALRYYEAEGLLQTAGRTEGNRRRYTRDTLRRIAFIRAAQQVGLSLEQIRAALATLPEGRTPTEADWQRLSESWRATLDQQIEWLERLRDRLDSCIGCGCLSLDVCSLYNPDDRAAQFGHGARFWKGNTSAQVTGT